MPLGGAGRSLLGAGHRAVSLTERVCDQVPGNKAAIGQHYNVASDRYISHDGVVQALAKAAGVEANIVHYDTKAVSLAKVLFLPIMAASLTWAEATGFVPWPYQQSHCCSCVVTLCAVANVVNAPSTWFCPGAMLRTECASW